jgi:hypothetical protein
MEAAIERGGPMHIYFSRSHGSPRNKQIDEHVLFLSLAYIFSAAIQILS